MRNDELIGGMRKGIDSTIGSIPDDQMGVDLAMRVIRIFDFSSVSADELAKDTYLGEESIVEHLR